MRRAIVVTLEALCGWFDKIPAAYRFDGRWHIGSGCWGCSVLRLAERSARLDERWRTEVWR